MKRITYISALLLSGMALITGCGSNHKNPGRTYMPDMAYSRAYESYAARDTNLFTRDPQNRGGKMIFYNAKPPAGTLKRGEMMDLNLPVDSNGYKMSAMVKNPYDTITIGKADMAESARLWEINCAICHGSKGTANGPLAGKVGGTANLTLPLYVAMADGTMFYSIEHGKNNMGSYASQLSRDQRWRIIKYIRTLQGGATVAAAPAADTAKAKTDTAAVAKK